MQARGFGDVVELHATEMDALSEKQAIAMTSLCAVLLDEEEGPIRGEPELIMFLLELTQDRDDFLYRHGATRPTR